MTKLEVEILDNLACAIAGRNQGADTNALAAETWADELEATARQLRGLQGTGDGSAS